MTPEAQVAELLKQYESCSADAAQLIESSSAEALSRRPAENSWSAAECFAHMNISAEALLPLLRHGITALRNRGETASRPFKLDLVARLLKWVLEPPSRMRAKTPPPFVPVGELDPWAEIARFIRLQDELRALLRQGADLALDREKIVSPFAKKLSYGVWSAFVVCAAHQRRHLWQARRAARL